MMNIFGDIMTQDTMEVQRPKRPANGFALIAKGSAYYPHVDQANWHRDYGVAIVRAGLSLGGCISRNNI